jgi:hypothetical protein
MMSSRGPTAAFGEVFEAVKRVVDARGVRAHGESLITYEVAGVFRARAVGGSFRLPIAGVRTVIGHRTRMPPPRLASSFALTRRLQELTFFRLAPTWPALPPSENFTLKTAKESASPFPDHALKQDPPPRKSSSRPVPPPALR